MSDGKVVATANPNAKKDLGIDIRTVKNAKGDPFGERVYAAAKEGQVNEVSYEFPKPEALESLDRNKTVDAIKIGA